MKTSTIASLAVTASLLLIAPTTVGAQAADNKADNKPAGTASSIDANSDTLKKITADFLAKKYGLDNETAKKRADAQNEFGKEAKKASDELRGDSAGSYIDQKRGVLVVQATKDEAKNKVKDKITKKDTEIKVVSRSMNTLEDQAKKLTEKLGDKLVSTRVDVQSNKLIATVKKDQVNSAKDAAKGMDGVDIEGTETLPTATAEIYGGQQIEFGGGKCSIAFNATKDGKDVFVTAGHCFSGQTPFTHNNKQLARPAAKDFPGSDMGYAVLEQGWTGQPGVDKWNGRGVAVQGSEEAAVGAAVCKSGRTTQWTCGVIQAKNVAVNFSRPGGRGFDRMVGLTQTNACAEPGDSGGAWISGSQAQGITSGSNVIAPPSGGRPQCMEKFGKTNTAYYQPLNPALQKYGLQLKTHKG
ncbi:Alpha-lytic protease [Austwickia sp. TVS 96-490-7B]|uniref:trypsin-like serine protease n=1 Tax=Austwickia sp. TVS 96-490-7B TaxID=2830843 RepID=UPI001C57D66D|nr:trypsin-like serine protease [Austwickia sp. TVS 96-490-7B]MBW3085946.1 Alpha-lytic protease [Austwickia sp. TVS 96-490-7B]